MTTFTSLIQIKADDRTLMALDNLCRLNAEKRTEALRRLVREAALSAGCWPEIPGTQRQPKKKLISEGLA